MPVEELESMQDLEAAMAADLGVEAAPSASPVIPAATPEPAQRGIKPEATPAATPEADPSANGEAPEANLPPWMQDPPADDETEDEPEAEATPAETAILGKLKDRFGVDLTGKYKDDDSALEGLVNAAKRLSARDEDATLGRMLRENPGEFYARLGQELGIQHQPAQPVPAAKAPEPEAGKKYDPATDFAKIYEDPTTGEVKELEPGVLKRIAAYQKDFLSNPTKYLPNVEEIAEQKAKALIADYEQRTAAQNQAAQQQFVEQQRATTFLNQATPWMFEGGVPANGMSQAGRQFQQQYLSLAQERPYLTQDDLVELTIGRLHQQHRSTNGKPSPRPAVPRAAVSKGNIRPPKPEDPDGAFPEDMTMEQILEAEMKSGRWTPGE